MSEDCPRCINNYECQEKCRGCFEGSNYKPKPPTNADRIRSMTDEQLAEEIWGKYEDGTLYECFLPKKDCIARKQCGKDCFLKWLKEEAKDDS